jgi:ATP-dependent DNA helicase RecG
MSILDSPIEYLKGVGPQRGELLKKELQLFTQGDLLFSYPYRYVDKTQFHRIADLDEQSGFVQLRGVLRRLDTVGEGRKKRMTGKFRDESGVIELVWFTGIHWLQQQLVVGREYVIYGRVNAFRDQLNIAHPEMEVSAADQATLAVSFDPVYASTEKLNNKGLDMKVRRRLVRQLLEKLGPEEIPEMLPATLMGRYRFPIRYQSIADIHFPKTQEQLEAARNRLKFEELFIMQLRILQLKHKRHIASRGYVFSSVGDQFHHFYKHHLPFELTGAQKRVVKEIRQDLGMGRQMNRLLQGDVGSGKTMVALLSMLIAIDNNYQACLMARRRYWPSSIIRPSPGILGRCL